ncbi:heterotrimeric G protein alpha subunit B [Lentinula edodes]|uniref:Heterotrimeric G protein alpha subunit B n=1 Tax=Lentinula edodes TaxID=5353 RepID=A0A1Q3EKQ6_LENED|nr:heterotrimeric G protein alpha subunit B [Lentinula edodes]
MLSGSSSTSVGGSGRPNAKFDIKVDHGNNVQGRRIDVQTVRLFLVSLSEYDQMLYEDESVNRMQEALTLFDSICNSRWFVKTSIILFLNKIDLFAEKLPRSPLGDYFPDYTGGDNYDAACEYLLHRFVSLNQSAATKQIYAHYTCATDTQQIKFVLSAIQDILLQLHLREFSYPYEFLSIPVLALHSSLEDNFREINSQWKHVKLEDYTCHSELKFSPFTHPSNGFFLFR